jgi:hypothetical protein
VSRTAWPMRSAETTGPTVVRRRYSAIGPSCAWSAAATLPISPPVGMIVPPRTVGFGLGLGEGLADGEGLGLGEGEGEGLGLGLGLGEVDAPALGDGDPLAVGEPLGDAPVEGAAEADALGPVEDDADVEADGLRVGTGVGLGTGAGRPIGFVRMVKNPSVEAVTVESARPCPTSTERIRSDVTAGSLNRTSHSVPPV